MTDPTTNDAVTNDAVTNDAATNDAVTNDAATNDAAAVHALIDANPQGGGSTPPTTNGSEGDKDGSSLLARKLRAMVYALVGADNDPSLHHYEPGPDNGATIARIARQSHALIREREGLRLWRAISVLGCGITPFAIIIAVPEWRSGVLSSAHWILGACLAYFEFFLLIALLFIRARVAAVNAQLQILEYENVLTAFKEDDEKRAANLFFKHQAELKQYYDQALRQNRQSFVLGIVCVGIGIGAILSVAALLVSHPDSATPARLTVGGLAILSALLTGFVARIYLRVYEESAKALGNFHHRLVSTNDYHFASLLIASITHDYQRTTALSKLAGVIAAPRATAENGD